MHAYLPARWFQTTAVGRLLRAGIALVVLALVAVTWIIYSVLPFALIRPSREQRDTMYSGVIPRQFGLLADDMWVETRPGLWLRVWFIHANGNAEPRGTVLLLHGSSSCKESMLGQAKIFADAGFNDLVFDMRAHGESGGMYRTFGYYERRDCSRILDEAERRFGTIGPFAVCGESMGGAIALQAMASDARIRCGIVMSTFATLREISHDYLREMIGIPVPIAADLAIRRAERLAKFSVDDVKPEEAARRIQRPVLLIHGTDDRNISIRYGERIFHNLHAPGSEWYPVKGGDHGNLWLVGGAAYPRKLIAFLTQYDR